MSEIIASIVDVYIPAMDYEGDDYVTTDNPLASFQRRWLDNIPQQKWSILTK